EKIRETKPQVIRILLTGYADIKAAEDAINKSEVFRFISKPWNDEELLFTINDGIKLYDLKEENIKLLEVTQKQNEELKKLDKLKDEFISNVSHELRTPLNSMNMIMSNIKVGIAGDYNQFPEKLREYMEIMEHNNSSLMLLVNDLLDIFKINSPDFKLVYELADFNDIIKKELDDMKIQFETKNITLETILGQCPNLELDPMRIRQVIRNLLSNALKFTNFEGKVSVITSFEDNTITCKISDTGIGIEPDFLTVIFERFRQVVEEAEGKPTGTGLGLSICQKIIELHGGKIWAESEYNKGSTFIFTLPVKTQ
ncbi:MAG: HAMP domain-containing sensor histidine kinase, partial [Candidatus Margulisbacteria bacterium]|nr:HAMP domain-containing sensor histidine kinase [Candidatus Margulisiibacteriota bacterium]